MEEDQLPRHCRRLRRKAVDRKNQRQAEAYGGIEHQHAEIGQRHQLAGVVAHLLIVPQSHALGADGGDGVADGHAAQDDKVAQRAADGIGRNGGSAEGGNQAEHHDLSQLKDAVLQAVGDSDAQDPADGGSVGADAAKAADVQNFILPLEKRHHPQRRQGPGDQRGDGRPLDAPPQAIEQYGVADQVHPVHEKGGEHGRPGVPHPPVHRRAGVVEGDEGDGGGHDQKIGAAVVHHIRLNPAEDHMENEVLSQIHQRHNQNGEPGGHQEHLLCGLAALLLLPAAQKLAGDDGPAGGQGGENVDNQDHDVVDQRHRRHRRLSHGGDHNGVEQSHGDRQKLLHDQGDNQPHQPPVAEEVALRHLPKKLLHSFHTHFFFRGTHIFLS